MIRFVLTRGAGILILAGLLSMSCSSSAVSKELGAEYYAIAQDYYEQKNYQKAAVYYRKAKNAKDLIPSASYGLARVLVIDKKFAEAEAELAPLVKKDPDNGIVLSAYAYVLASLHRYDDALVYYRKLRDRNELELKTGINFMSLLYYAGAYKEMSQTLSSFLELYPDDSDIKKMEILHALKTSKEDGKDKAIAWLEQSGNESDVFMLTALAQYYADSSRFDDSLNIYQKIKNPADDILLEMAYLCYEKADKHDAAGEHVAAVAKKIAATEPKKLDVFLDRLSPSARDKAAAIIDAAKKSADAAAADAAKSDAAKNDSADTKKSETPDTSQLPADTSDITESKDSADTGKTAGSDTKKSDL